jgi:hypothetical protein
VAKPGDLYVITVEEDGSRWAVPVDVIARDRAAHYAHEFGDDVERSLAEDTWPAFADDFEVQDWARNNMNWDDVKAVAWQWEKDVPPEPDYQEAWMNGDNEVLSPSPSPSDQKGTK